MASFILCDGNCASTVVGVMKNCEAILVIVAAGRQFFIILNITPCIYWEINRYFSEKTKKKQEKREAKLKEAQERKAAAEERYEKAKKK